MLTQSKDIISVSDFQGSLRDRKANKPTHLWWRRLKYWMSRQGVKLTPSGHKNYSFWAFPSAMDKLKTGMEYLARG